MKIFLCYCKITGNENKDEIIFVVVGIDPVLNTVTGYMIRNVLNDSIEFFVLKSMPWIL